MCSTKSGMFMEWKIVLFNLVKKLLTFNVQKKIVSGLYRETCLNNTQKNN